MNCMHFGLLGRPGVKGKGERLKDPGSQDGMLACFLQALMKFLLNSLDREKSSVLSF